MSNGGAKTSSTDLATVPIFRVPGFLATLVSTAAAFCAWALLLPVIPQAVLDEGGSNTAAGAITGVFMAATVLTQTQTPLLLRNLGYRATMLISAVFLALPTLGHLISMDGWLVLTIAALRGVGFGCMTVAQSALLAELVPSNRLGRAAGLMGMCIGLAELIGLPAGLLMADSVGYPPVYIVATIIGAIGGVMALLIPNIKAAPKAANGRKDSASATDSESEHQPARPLWRLVLVPIMAMSCVSMAFGGVSTFLAPAARAFDPVAGATVGGICLGVVGAGQMLARYVAGAVADRAGGAGKTLAPGLMLAVLGMVATAFVLSTDVSAWWILPAALLYGMGFGTVQNESLLLLFERLTSKRASQASALWNIAFDGGTGIGSFVLGAVAAAGFVTMFGTAGAIIFVGFVAAIADAMFAPERKQHRLKNVEKLEK